MKKMLLTPLIVCIVALLSTLSMPVVHATPSTPVSGIFDYTYDITAMREAGGNLFIYATEDEVWVGDFAGTSEAIFRVKIHSAGFWDVWLRSEFTGTVQGKTGTLVVQLVGRRTGEPFWWYGQWVILSGTAELANLRGQGTWWGPGYESNDIPGERPDIYYSGQIHFD